MEVRVVRRHRSGVAPIEFLMVLPTLTVLFILLVTIAGGGLMCYRLSVEARHEAWTDRELVARPATIDGGATYAHLAKVLGTDGGTAPVRAGKLAGSRTGRFENETFGLLADQLPDAQREHITFAGVWDHRVLDFEDRNGGADRLRMDVRMRAIDPGLDLNAFERLVPSR